QSDKFDKWLNENQLIVLNKEWIKMKNGEHGTKSNVSLQTFIRHSIHHPENKLNDSFTNDQLKESCNEMIKILKNINGENH
ncbi:MAG: hypothetical protein KAQ62_13240, partial [Cyclobacteriaceae bacterium]|nr:hypothetical protein [Cyclobacteriaceae bacterium]